jgi:hypothetical protein
MSKVKIDVKQIRKQLQADLIGKDSYRGVTLTYSWLANQFGHFSLGYIPTLIAWDTIRKHTTWKEPAFWAALIISIFWFLFEMYNFLVPLLLKQHSAAQRLFVPSKEKYIFHPDWRNVAFDTLTDLLFFWFGVFSASLFLQYSGTTLFILVVLFLAILYPARYWYLTKMHLQYSKFPMQFRLSQWKRPPKAKPLKEDDINTVLSFIENASKSDGNHLLIFGGRRSDKSALGIGIGTELSIKRCPSSYYTAMKLFNLFSLSEQEIMETDDYNVWDWRTSSLLIIDDIDPGSRMQKAVLSAQDLLNAIDSRGNNRDCLKNKNVVWVLGDEAPTIAGSWQKLLLVDIGVEENRISAVGLGSL